MGENYKGFGLNKKYVGEVKDGNVTTGFGLGKKRKGYIKDGTVYRGYGLNREIAGSIEGDTIYRGYGLDREIIGYVENGKVYSGFGLNRELVSTCDSVEDGAALLLLQSESSPAYSDGDFGSAHSGFSGGHAPEVPKGMEADGAAVFAFVMLALIAIATVVGAVLVWPIVFSSHMQSDPGAPLYTALSILCTVAGVALTALLYKGSSFKNYWMLCAVPTSLLLNIALFIVDRKNYDPVLGIFAITFVALLFCGIPALVVWLVKKALHKKFR